MDGKDSRETSMRRNQVKTPEGFAELYKKTLENGRRLADIANKANNSGPNNRDQGNSGPAKEGSSR